MNWIARRKRLARRRRLLHGIGAAALVMTGAFLAGMLLPEMRVRQGTLSVDRSPEVVWWVLTDLDGMPGWRSDLRAVERLPDRGGRLAWKETGPDGSRVVELLEVEPLHRLVMGRAAGLVVALRTIELARARGGGGTLVTVTEAEPVRNPFARVLTRLPMLGEGTPRFLRDLAARLGDRPPVVMGRRAG